MRKVWLVFKREYITRVRTKAFIFGTLALPLLSLGVLAISVFVSSSSPSRVTRIAILDASGGLGKAVANELTENVSSYQSDIEIVETLENPSKQAEASLRDQVLSGELDGFLVLPKEVLTGEAQAELHARNFRAASLLGQVQRAISDALISSHLDAEGQRSGNMTHLYKLTQIRLVRVTAADAKETSENSFVTAIIVGILLYMTLIIYGMSTMRSVMEEKSTRIIEILVSSINPFHLLSGKIISVGAVALTQYAVWALTIGIMVTYSRGIAQMLRPGVSGPPLHLPFALLAYLVIFFLAGYFLYASLYAAAGAIVSTDEEAHQVQLPLTLMIICSFLLFNVILNDPNSTLSVVLSIMPFLSPILMTLRIAVQPPPFWQIALALLLSIVTTLGVIRLSAKIYRVGILMYGKRPSLRELRRWLRYS